MEDRVRYPGDFERTFMPWCLAHDKEAEHITTTGRLICEEGFCDPWECCPRFMEDLD